MKPVRVAARAMLASMFVGGSIDVLRNPAPRAEAARPVIDRITAAVPQLPRDPVTLVRLNAAVQLAAAALLATGRLRRPAAAVLAVSLVPTTFGGHRFWTFDDPAQRKQQQIHFQKNVAMLGGLLLAAVDTEGAPGVSWRTRRAAKDARRLAKGAAKDAKRIAGDTGKDARRAARSAAKDARLAGHAAREKLPLV